MILYEGEALRGSPRGEKAQSHRIIIADDRLPDGYYYVDRTDVPGENNVNIVMDDTPVYARETVEYIGEHIGMVCGPDEAVCQDIHSRIQVEYEALETMLDLRKADEAFPSILGCQVAAAAKKCGKPVRCIFDRREDLEFTSKRHPSLCTYKVAVKDGKVTAMDIDVKFNGGAYTILPAMVDEVNRACGLRRKHKEYAKPQTGRYRRGIGFSMHFHGAGFTGSGERDLIKAVARLHKYKDGTVEILASSGENGQGLRTTFPKIVAHELNLPLEKVFYDHPDTSRVPDVQHSGGGGQRRYAGAFLHGADRRRLPRHSRGGRAGGAGGYGAAVYRPDRGGRDDAPDGWL